MINRWLQKFFGSKHERDVKRLMPLVDAINEIYNTLHGLTDDELKEKTETFRETIRQAVGDIQDRIQKEREKLKSVTEEGAVDFDAVRRNIEVLEKEEGDRKFRI